MDKMIRFEKSFNKDVTEIVKDSINYNQIYGGGEKFTGKKVKIAILDTGLPSHNDIIFKTKVEAESFCEDNMSIDDKDGHSTIVSGIIGANSSKLVGIAPDASLLFAKVVNDRKISNFNSIVAAVLWAVVKEVDVIVMALGSQFEYNVLYDAVKKAKDRGICVFAASGTGDEEDIDFPARYPEVFSAGFMGRKKEDNNKIKSKTDFYLPNKKLLTTYLGNKYIKAGGSSISTAFFAGLAALYVEKYKGKEKKQIPSMVYDELLKFRA